MNFNSTEPQVFHILLSHKSKMELGENSNTWEELKWLIKPCKSPGSVWGGAG